MHKLFSGAVRSFIIGLTIVGFLVFCIRNFVWNEPVFDFRPFQAGKDVRNTKLIEAESEANVQITHYKMTNNKDGKVVTLPYDQYMKEYKQYPKSEWEFEQIKTKPEIEPTKISDFEVSDSEGHSVTDEILDNPDYSFMVVSYKLKTKGDVKQVTQTVQDTVYTIDTVLVDGMDEPKYVKSIKSVVPREETFEVTQFEPGFVSNFHDIINPVVEEAEKAGYKVFAVTAPNSNEVIEDFRHASQSSYPFYTADDLLIKTIQRSNPGLVLWKDGKIVQKWHINKVTSFEDIKSKYLQ